MARSFARLVIHNRARFHADMENSASSLHDTGVTDVRVNELIDVHTAETWRELVKAAPPDYYSSDYAIVTSAGVVSYALPADFYRSVRAFRVLDANRQFPIEEIDGDVRAYFQPPRGAYSITLEYIPAPPIADTSTTGDAATFDGIAGYEEYIAKLTAVDLLRKESSGEQAASLRAECADIRRQIQRTAKRSTGSRAILDREGEGFDQIWYAGASSGVCAYRIRAGNVELYERRATP